MKTYANKMMDSIRSSNPNKNGNVQFGNINSNNRQKMYHIGDIMLKGNQMARLSEIQDIADLNLDIDCYSAMLNEKINDKTGVTEEENNKLAEHILQADVDRLFDADIIVAESLHSSIGSLCELGILHGWQTSGEKLDEILTSDLSDKDKLIEVEKLKNKLNKDCYIHSWDLRNTNLKESGWRRSHSLNQLLYGMVMRLASDKDMLTWEEILTKLEERYR